MATPGLWGAEFLVNSVTTGAQMSPVITALSGGGFAVAYTDFSKAGGLGFTDFSDNAVRVQVFDSSGTAQSNLIQVNSVTTYEQQSPRIASLNDGGFVVVYSDASRGWNSMGGDTWEEAVRLQRFAGDGTKAGSEIRVNTTVLEAQDFPNVVRLQDGRVLVTWNNGSDPETRDVNGQLFATDGSFSGGEFRVNAGSIGGQVDSETAALAGGGYAVAFVDTSGADGDRGGIFVRVFGADGTALTGDIAANTTTAADQFQPAITPLQGGGFFVVWTDNSRGLETGGDDNSGYAVRGQVFDAAGARVGSEILVNSSTSNGQLQPDAIALADGRFVVTWSDTSQGDQHGGDDPHFGAIRARLFNHDGSPASDEFLVNATTVGHQNEPQIAQLADGRLVFTWTDYSYGAETGGDDSDNGAIRARILTLDPPSGGTGGPGSQTGDGGDGGDGGDAGDGGDGGSGDGGDGGSGGTTTPPPTGPVPATEIVNWTGDGDDNHFIGSAFNDTLTGEHGHDSLYGAGGHDQIFGGPGKDTLTGGAGRDMIRGNQDHDRIKGGSANDSLSGGIGRDFLEGGSGRDRIGGGSGNDTIVGGPGADLINGGYSRDVFVYTDVGDSTRAACDYIRDYKDGFDKIDLSAFDAKPATAADDAFAFVNHNGFSGKGGEVRYINTATRCRIKIDVDGDGREDMMIELKGFHDLTAADFIL